jgi:hypothetical protein
MPECSNSLGYCIFQGNVELMDKYWNLIKPKQQLVIQSAMFLFEADICWQMSQWLLSIKGGRAFF